MKQNVWPFVLMEPINMTKESINTEQCWCHARLPPSPVPAWFELLPITGWREATQLLELAVTQAYLK